MAGPPTAQKAQAWSAHTAPFWRNTSRTSTLARLALTLEVFSLLRSCSYYACLNGECTDGHCELAIARVAARARPLDNKLTALQCPGQSGVAQEVRALSLGATQHSSPLGRRRLLRCNHVLISAREPDDQHVVLCPPDPKTVLGLVSTALRLCPHSLSQERQRLPGVPVTLIARAAAPTTGRVYRARDTFHSLRKV